MTPGLAGPPFPSRATRGAVVAVASLEKPTVPMVVGVCEIDISSLQKTQGAKGHAVKGQHWAGDEIWAWNQTGKSGGEAPEAIEGWDMHEGGMHAGVKDLSIDDSEDDSHGGVSVTLTDSQQQEDEPYNPYVEGEDVEPFEGVDEPSKELSAKGRMPMIINTPPKRLRLCTLIDEQRSTKYSGRLSYMRHNTTRTQTRAIQTMASAFHFINLWSSPTSFYHICLLLVALKQPLYRSRKPAGRMPRSSSKP